MLFNKREIEWIKNGGEVDFPRLPDTQINEPGNQQGRSLRFNEESGMFEYYQREAIAGGTNWMTEQTVGQIYHQSYGLEDLIEFTNEVHKIDDDVEEVKS